MKFVLTPILMNAAFKRYLEISIVNMSLHKNEEMTELQGANKA
ncbi:hypothetical protein [Leptospira ainazelensis]|nr:hypothetical protein [Leptospira ainazelensis]